MNHDQTVRNQPESRTDHSNHKGQTLKSFILLATCLLLPLVAQASDNPLEEDVKRYPP